MDETVIRAMEKWPAVPAVWGWLSLDRRGVWRLKGETIPNRAAIDFIARNYASDRDGRWFFQNGPQRVFVDLAYTPWVYSLDGRGALVTHTGLDCGAIGGAWIDEAGAMILLGEPGPGLVDDRDLPALSDRLVDKQGVPVDDAVIDVFVTSPAGSEPELRLEHNGNRVRVRRIDSGEVARRLRFDPHPAVSVSRAASPRSTKPPEPPEPSGPIDVVAIRHAPTAWNDAGRIQGHTDVPLSEDGRRALAGRRLPERFGSYRAHSSPLARAVETAALLGLETPLLDRRLMEMDWGGWEGRTRASVTAADPGGSARNEAKGPDFRPPGGESPREVQARIIDWARSAAAGAPPGAARNHPGPAGGVVRSATPPSPHVVAVTHKGVIKALLGLACGWDLTGKSPVRLDWTRAHRFRFDPATGAFTLDEPNIRLERDG